MIIRLAAVALALLLSTAPLARAVDVADEMLPAAEAATKQGLAYLAAQQHPDGSWPEAGGSTGVVAACALAFMAHGHLPGSGQYGQVTARALQFLLRHATPEGLLYRNGVGPHPMYHHGLATLALAEAWGQTADDRLRETLRRAIELICTTQNAKGGWRYQPKVSDDDLSVTVFQLMALRAAKDAGLEVPKEIIDAGIEYVKRCHNGKGAGKDGGFGYTPGDKSGFARSGAGVTSLQVAGNYKALEVSEGIEYLLQFQPVGEQKGEDQWYYYGAYYATMGIYQAQGLGAWGRKAWSRWYPAMTRDLLARQKPDGQWDSGYKPYPTAMALLILEIPCRYLPIYQR